MNKSDKQIIAEFFWGKEKRGRVIKEGLYHIAASRFEAVDIPQIKLVVAVMHSGLKDFDQDYVYSTLRMHCNMLYLDYNTVKQFYINMLKKIGE